MEHNKDSPENYDDYPAAMDAVIETLTLQAMAEGNSGYFNTAFATLESALWLTRSLGKTKVEAALLNNQGLLHTMNGEWDSAMLAYDRSMAIALEFCPSNDRFLNILRNNIACLFDPQVATPINPEIP